MPTKISWTNETWGPVTGCSHVSAGCEHCYAEVLSLRRGWSKVPWTARNAAENVILHPDRLRKPLSWRTPRRVFVNSMSDVFHELVPDSFVDEMFDVMERVPMHTFQILTKRPGRMAMYVRRRYGDAGAPEHIWLGTSIEDDRVIDRLDQLGLTPAVHRFISAEPLLGPLVPRGHDQAVFELRERLQAAGVDWVIVGGESGPGYRPMAMAWARAIRDATVAAGAAFFFKQSAAFRTETRPYLIEEDGSHWQWHQWPDNRVEPVQV